MNNKYLVSLLAILLSFLSSSSLGQFKKIQQTSTLGVDFILKDYSKKNKMVPGVAISYAQGFIPKFNWAMMASGCFIDSAVKGFSSSQKKLNLEAHIVVSRHLANSYSRFQPFIASGIGCSYFDKNYGLFIPLGVGLQTSIKKDIFTTLNLQYRYAVTPPFSSHFFFSLGISGALNRKNTNKNTTTQLKKYHTHINTQQLFKDRDHDGIDDNEDRCPDAAGSLTNDGCPYHKTNSIKKDSISMLLAMLAKNIYFENNSHILQSSSFKSLDKVSELLINNPDIKLKIEGHTDNVGNNNNNLSLSQNRANAVTEYLNMKGISMIRLQPGGYGESKHIADNSTIEGRAANRRVELIIFY